MLKKLLILVVFFLGVISVDAATEKIYVGDKIPGMFIRKIDSSGKETVKRGGFIRRASDNKAVYCVEPFVALIDNYTYTSYTSDYADVLNISDEVWKKISLIAYYGYGYENHTEDYWYYITQMMIWREVEPDAQFYFTKTLGGENDLTLYALEIEEIESLVNEHYITPKFDKIEVMLGETKSFKDENDCLSNYEVVDDNIKINGNELVVTGDVVGSKSVTLKKVSNNFNDMPIVYADGNSQNVLCAGNIDDVEMPITINVVGAKIKLLKVDAISNEMLKIAGIKFQIYNSDTNELVFEGETNEEGILETDYIFGKGTYKIVEVKEQTIPGYVINETEVYFEVDKEKEIVIEFANYPVVGKIEVLKVDENDSVLPGVTIGLYNLDGTLVDIQVSDEEGRITFENLIRGKYILKELATLDGYILDDTEYKIDLELDEDNNIKPVTIKLVNKKEKGSIEILKVNSNNEPLENTEFTLYNDKMEEVTKKETNSEGKIVIDNLDLGKYYLKETKASLGYQITQELVEIDITKDKQVITVTVTNELIEVDIPDTGINYARLEFILPRRKNLLK